ncbi:hypothetical protein IEI94_10240 [Halomonas sp. ML-15]|uniref:glycosyltransferase family 8 protein n=1 Tax=Halomonas sp. ML-15 TaxID=2773305 RepID=UPI001745E60F|nr:glycosyltransferase [Halomonas sp. ML-15]MBD3896228.1 hypothetical protein [Halomonas sp. ML-15]
MQRYLLVGSAPHVKEYLPKVINTYLERGFKICPINNAWSLFSGNEGIIDTWIAPQDFFEYGSVIPNEEQLGKINTLFMAGTRVQGYMTASTKQSTMILNALHILLNRAILESETIEVVVLGSDFVYNKNASHFYEHSGKIAPSVAEGLSRHHPEYASVAADPLRFGEKWLLEELAWVKRRYETYCSKVYRDSPYIQSKLPFEKYPLADIYTAVDKNLIDYIDHLFASVEENSTIGCRYHIVVPEAEADLFHERYPYYHIHGISCSEFNSAELGRFGEGMFLRYYIPRIQKKGNAVYFDNDVAVLGDVRELWEMDLGDSFLAAVPSCFRKKLGIEEEAAIDSPVKAVEWSIHGSNSPCPNKYRDLDVFFSGQFVLNCDNCLSGNLLEEIAQVAIEYKVYDMAALICAVKGKWVPLDKEWYCAGYILGYGSGYLTGNMSYLIQDQKYGSPKLIHWNGKAKPWVQRNGDSENCYYVDVYNFYKLKGGEFSKQHRKNSRNKRIKKLADECGVAPIGYQTDLFFTLLLYKKIKHLAETVNHASARDSLIDNLTSEISRDFNGRSICYTTIVYLISDSEVERLFAIQIFHKLGEFWGVQSLVQSGNTKLSIDRDSTTLFHALSKIRLKGENEGLKMIDDIEDANYKNTAKKLAAKIISSKLNG